MENNKHKNCPNCEDGVLYTKKGKYGDFYTCSNFPRCKYTESLDGTTHRRVNTTRRDFLLSFFPVDGKYEELKMNNFYLIKTYDKLTKSWRVEVYTKETYEAYKEARNKNKIIRKITPKEGEGKDFTKAELPPHRQ